MWDVEGVFHVVLLGFFNWHICDVVLLVLFLLGRREVGQQSG